MSISFALYILILYLLVLCAHSIIIHKCKLCHECHSENYKYQLGDNVHIS